MIRDRKFGEILMDLHVLSSRQVDLILEAMRRRRDRKKFGQVARDMGLLREEDILAALAVQMQLFPGVRDLSLPRILHRLQNLDSQAPAPQQPSSAKAN